MTVFKRWPDGAIRLHWASELLFEPTDPGQDMRHMGTVEPLSTLFDLTPGRRPNTPRRSNMTAAIQTGRRLEVAFSADQENSSSLRRGDFFKKLSRTPTTAIGRGIVRKPRGHVGANGRHCESVRNAAILDELVVDLRSLQLGFERGHRFGRCKRVERAVKDERLGLRSSLSSERLVSRIPHMLTTPAR